VFLLEDVKRCFGARCALDGVSLQVHRGERVAVIGPSGAGKTTLFRVMNLTLPPSSGTVRFDGCLVDGIAGRRLRAMRRRIGTIHQQHHLVPALRVVHNVLAGRLGSWPLWRAALSLWLPQEEDRARRALAEVGLEDKIYRRTDTLSGGEQQRVAIARVLVQEPDVILADEPVASVDPATARSIMRLLFDLADRHGLTLVVSLHDVDLALEFFPRVIALREGKIRFDRPPDAIRSAELRDLYGAEWGVAPAQRPAEGSGGAGVAGAGCIPPPR
jgi:phosphonate transport system ATP-binding protein